ncbi:hypothetical protein GCM10027275_25050 [Rhabdobacter roseus]|uniref:Uncharacterized protein n=1 Tax=Rhabdobacter roseus TaxID=1655419 RepID=A0A840TND3_9BACT|nr:hypothetical protein [Rhabdobacter roseus]MBB5284445.1 hypothetical protein [Rhabdobacter roseus]
MSRRQTYYKHPEAASAFNELMIELKKQALGHTTVPLTLEQIEKVERLVFPLLEERQDTPPGAYYHRR